MHGNRITGFHRKLIWLRRGSIWLRRDLAWLRRNVARIRRDEKAKGKAKRKGAADQSPNALISRTPQTIALI
jgi:hypothetical protein